MSTSYLNFKFSFFILFIILHTLPAYKADQVIIRAKNFINYFCQDNIYYIQIKVDFSSSIDHYIFFNLDMVKPNNLQFKCLISYQDKSINCFSVLYHSEINISYNTELEFPYFFPEIDEIEWDYDSFVMMVYRRWWKPDATCFYKNIDVLDENVNDNDYSLVADIKEISDNECLYEKNKYSFNMKIKFRGGVSGKNIKIEREKIQILQSIWVPLLFEKIDAKSKTKYFGKSMYFQDAYCDLSDEINKNNFDNEFLLKCNIPIDEEYVIKGPIKIVSFYDQVYVKLIKERETTLGLSKIYFNTIRNINLNNNKDNLNDNKDNNKDNFNDNKDNNKDNLNDNKDNNKDNSNDNKDNNKDNLNNSKDNNKDNNKDNPNNNEDNNKDNSNNNKDNNKDNLNNNKDNNKDNLNDNKDNLNNNNDSLSINKDNLNNSKDNLNINKNNLNNNSSNITNETIRNLELILENSEIKILHSTRNTQSKEATKFVEPNDNKNKSYSFLLGGNSSVFFCPDKPILKINKLSNIQLITSSKSNYTLQLIGTLYNPYKIINGVFFMMEDLNADINFHLTISDNLIEDSDNKKTNVSCTLQLGTSFNQINDAKVLCTGNKIKKDSKKNTNVNIILNWDLIENKKHRNLVILWPNSRKHYKNLYSYNIQGLSLMQKNYGCFNNQFYFFIYIYDLGFEPQIDFDLEMKSPTYPKANCKLYDSMILKCYLPLYNKRIYRGENISLPIGIEYSNINSEGNRVVFRVANYTYDYDDFHIVMKETCGDFAMIGALKNVGLSFFSIVIWIVGVLAFISIVLICLIIFVYYKVKHRGRKGKYYAHYEEDNSSGLKGSKIS